MRRRRIGTARFATGLALLVSLVIVPAVSHGDEDGDIVSVEADGEADADEDEARKEAIDRAFIAAVSDTVRQMIDRDVRREYRGDIRRKILRRARIYVRSYKVLEEVEEGGQLRVRIRAKVRLNKLRDTLSDIGIEVQPDGDGDGDRNNGDRDGDGDGDGDGDVSVSDGDVSDGDSQGGPRPKVAVLLLSRVDGETQVTFGADGSDGGATGQALSQALRGQGFNVVSATGSGSAPSGDGDGDGDDDDDGDSASRRMPMSDEAAAALARQIGAGGVFLIGSSTQSDGSIRGTRMFGAQGRAKIRVLDITGSEILVVARANVRGAGFGGDQAAALDAAGTDTAGRLLADVAAEVSAYWPPVVKDTGGAVTVEIRGYRGWQSIASLLRALNKTRGIDRAWPLEVGGRGVIVAVETSLEQRRLISAIRRADIPTARRLSVSALGDRSLEVRIRGDGRSEP